MKKIGTILLGCLITTLAFAQPDPSADLANSIQHLPKFSVVKAPDSSRYDELMLPKGKPFVLVFFSPDCEHCQKQVKEFMAYRQELKDVSMLLLSPLSYRIIHNFYEEYGLAAIPNIKVASDAVYRLGKQYQLKTFPSIFVYDASGNLAKAFIGNVSIPTLLESLK